METLTCSICNETKEKARFFIVNEQPIRKCLSCLFPSIETTTPFTHPVKAQGQAQTANMTAMRKTIRKARRNGATLKSLAQQYGVTTGTVQRLLDGAYPDAANARRLGIPEKCTACKRNVTTKQPRTPAPLIGRDAGWIEYWMRTK